MQEVLDKGFVRLIDWMGDDDRVLAAARVSTGSGKSNPKRDEKLIRYLMKNLHETPFEKLVFEFHVKCPIFVARQWFRHRIGSFNEASARYKEFNWQCYIPDEWRAQDTKNKQGSITELDFSDTHEGYKDRVKNLFQDAKQLYEEMLADGIARELARIVMPVSQYTEFYWTVNFRALMNFLKLRMDSHAQYEIRQYANACFDQVKATGKFEWSIKAFEDYILTPFMELNQQNDH